MFSSRIKTNPIGNDKVMMTAIGGIAIRLTNKTVLHFN